MDVDRVSVDDWLANRGTGRKGAGHNLDKLATRLDDLLSRLGLDKLPSEAHAALISLHELDPGGDAFRYAKVRGPGGWQDAPRPLLSAPEDLQALVDVVAMP